MHYRQFTSTAALAPHLACHLAPRVVRVVMGLMLVVFGLVGCTAGERDAPAGPKPIRIALIYDKTGPLEAYVKQTREGLLMGLDFATNGTMKVAGRAIEVMERDSMGKPDVAKAELSAAYADDRADIAFGAAGSGVSLAMLPVAEEYQKLLIIEPAVADSITGAKWNPYVFRTARNSTQDAVANAIALDEPGLAIGTLAQDNAFGRDGVTAFRQALKQARIVHEEYLPPATSDFTAGAQRLIDKLKDHAGRRIIFISWAGSGNPFKIADLDLTRYGIEVATGGNILPQLANYKAFPGMQGATYYFYGIPDNAMNAEMVKRHLEKFGAPPDFFTAGGFSAAMALVTAFEKTGGVTDTHTLRAAMRGMTFQTPKGRMVFRAEDHQALQSMYHFKIRVDPAVKWAIPEKVREITLEEIDVPIQNRHAVR